MIVSQKHILRAIHVSDTFTYSVNHHHAVIQMQVVLSALCRDSFREIKNPFTPQQQRKGFNCSAFC
jgi:hypothetical protein